ncbi:integral membrane protein [Rutstroemia sp. NJR-2017a BVV2]|nr:integral membrane protein [Rutstroemia sp. NJR-2017a BVV2]
MPTTMSDTTPPPEGWINPSEAPMHPRAVLLIGPVTVFYFLGVVAIILRIWARYLTKVSWRLSDYAVIIAFFFGTGYVAICWIAADRGALGYPVTRVAVPEQILIRKVFFAGWLFQSWANSFIRLSILDFMLKVFPVKKFRRFVYFLQGATIAYLVACTIVWFAICRPFRYNWLLGPTTRKHCGNLSVNFLLSAIFNIILDVCIIVLPMPMLWKLHMNTHKKVALSFVFGLGIFVCFATGWRTYNVVVFSRPEDQINFTASIIEDALWSGLEITLGIINACLPVIQPAAQRLCNFSFLRLITSSTKASTKQSHISAGPPSNYSRFTSWVRLGNPKDEPKGGIQRAVEYSVDIESESGRNIRLDDMGSMTGLAGRTEEIYHDPLTNQYSERKTLS